VRTRSIHPRGWFAVQIYNAAEALPNLINPFWMLGVVVRYRMQKAELFFGCGKSLFKAVCDLDLD
jgi:hypothetical protein